MNQVIEYKILREVDPIKLSAQVNALIKQGFQPLSGPCACADASCYFLNQALVKFKTV